MFRGSRMMKFGIVSLAVCLIASCAHLQNAQYQERTEGEFIGAHAALAACAVAKLQSDGRPFLRPMQFRNRQFSDIHASEIHAYDTRYLRNAIATYAPSNPDAVLIYGNPAVEIESTEQRRGNDQQVYAFALLLQQINDTTVQASLRGDVFFGQIAWKILQGCAASATNF